MPLLQGPFLDDQDRVGHATRRRDRRSDGATGVRRTGSDRQALWIGIWATIPVTVVGVVGHVRQWGLAGDDQASVRAQLYYPFTQVPDGLLRRWSELMSIAVRTNVAPSQHGRTAASRSARFHRRPGVVSKFSTMEQLRQRFARSTTFSHAACSGFSRDSRCCWRPSAFTACWRISPASASQKSECAWRSAPLLGSDVDGTAAEPCDDFDRGSRGRARRVGRRAIPGPAGCGECATSSRGRSRSPPRC